MKKIFFSILAMAAMAACATDETVVAPKGEAIEFGNAFVDNSVRAIDPTYSGTKELETINVYGAINNSVNIFNATPVTGSVGNNVWTCGVTQYWIAGGNYEFAAVADVTDVATDVTTSTPAGIPTAIFYDASVLATDGSQRDLLYAYVSRNNVQPTYSAVDFSFSHLLSKVNVTFQNTTVGAEDAYNIDVRNITITDPYKSATYNITNNSTNNTWSGAWDETTATTVADYKVNFGNISDVKNGKSATIATEKLLIPTTQTLTVTFTVDICNGNTVITTTNYTETIETNLVAGYSYNLLIKQSLGSKIEFTVTANPTWDNGNTDDTDVPTDGVNDIVPVN